jgi:hypothetical protein
MAGEIASSLGWLSIPVAGVRRIEVGPNGRVFERKVPSMGQYLVLLYESESAWSEVDDAGRASILEAHNAFGAKHGAKIAGGNALQPTATATTVISDGAGGFTVTDGPFVESKEALGGYYLIEAADLDEAIAISKDVPAGFGGVEVRPIMVFS